MNHQKVYDSIIEKARKENRKRLRKNQENYIYYENHHIIPKCLGGNDEKENKVLLTAREHFICHKLLIYIYPNNRKIGLAVFRMAFNKKGKHNISSRDYAYAKKLNSKYIWNRGLTKETNEIIKKQGKNRSKKFKEGEIDTSNFGIKTIEGLKKISETHKGKPKSFEHRKKLSEANEGKTLSKETRDKMSTSRKGVPQKILTCPYCNKEGGTTMYRWHFENCKNKK
jgi:hypothetical protein